MQELRRGRRWMMMMSMTVTMKKVMMKTMTVMPTPLEVG
jgi:hypothetical protein